MDAEALGGLDNLRRFDFGDAGHVTNEQLRMLRSLDELLARNLTHALSAWLRTSVNVTASPQVQQNFQEFMDGSEEQSLLPIQLPELHATGLLRWPLALAAHMIELLLGGTGGPQTEVRELTEIEDAVFSAVLDVVLREWNAAWEQIALRMELGERARNGGERQLLPPNEKVFCFTFAVAVGEAAGDVALCLAAPVLASVLRRVSSLKRSVRMNAEAELHGLLLALREARVRTGLCFAPVSVSASKLAKLQVGSTLVLPLPANAGAELRISDVPVAAAMPVRVGERRAVRVGMLRDRAAHPALLGLGSGTAVEVEGSTA